MKPLNTLIIGIGNMGSAHAACIASGQIDGMRLYSVCDICKDRLDTCLKKYPDVKAYTDWREAVSDPMADAVVIAVPHPLHADISIFALEHGKHVLVEKPIDITVSKARKLNGIARNCDKTFGIMFNQRTDNLFAEARRIVKDGELGELKRSVWIVTNWYRTQHYYDSGSWRATWAGEGGGVLLNQAPHNLDLWQWICGMPESITAFCDVAKYHNIEVEDDVTLFARYKNGATGTFISSTGEYPGTNRLEISGTLGKLVIEQKKLRFWKLPESERKLCKESDQNTLKLELELSELDALKQPAHAKILQNFTDNILKGTPLIAPGTDGINQLMLSNAAYLSAWKGSIPVTLPFDENEYDARLRQHQKTSSLRKNDTSVSFSDDYSSRWQVKW